MFFMVSQFSKSNVTVGFFFGVFFDRSFEGFVISRENKNQMSARLGAKIDGIRSGIVAA